MDRLDVDDAQIEFEVRGEGAPVLLIPPALVIDALAHPLFAEPEIASQYQLIHYHRRGDSGSTLGSEPLAMSRQARDAAALLMHLGIKRAHIVGYSYSGVIALQFAAQTPELVHTLALLEPALRLVPSGTEYYEHTVFPMIKAYRAGDKRMTVQIFCDTVFGPNWQPIVERAIPGIVEQALHDVDTFMLEQPAMQQWQFGPELAASIHQPVLSILGVRSYRLFQEGRPLLHSWLPQTEDCDVQATHMLTLQDAPGVAHCLADFFSRHPMVSAP